MKKKNTHTGLKYNKEKTHLSPFRRRQRKNNVEEIGFRVV